MKVYGPERAAAIARRREKKAKWARDNRPSRAKPKVPKRCERCKREFVPARSDAKFCSGDCRGSAHDVRHRLTPEEWEERRRQVAAEFREQEKRMQQRMREVMAEFCVDPSETDPGAT